MTTLLLNYCFSNFVGHSVVQYVTLPYYLLFINPNTIIPSVILLIYIEEIFPLAYLRTYFTVMLILLVMPPVKSYTSLYCLIYFFHSLFSHCNSLGIYWGNFFVDVYWWIYRSKIMSVKINIISWKKNYSVFFGIY